MAVFCPPLSDTRSRDQRYDDIAAMASTMQADYARLHLNDRPDVDTRLGAHMAETTRNLVLLVSLFLSPAYSGAGSMVPGAAVDTILATIVDSQRAFLKMAPVQEPVLESARTGILRRLSRNSRVAAAPRQLGSAASLTGSVLDTLLTALLVNRGKARRCITQPRDLLAVLGTCEALMQLLVALHKTPAAAAPRAEDSPPASPQSAGLAGADGDSLLGQIEAQLAVCIGAMRVGHPSSIILDDSASRIVGVCSRKHANGSPGALDLPRIDAGSLVTSISDADTDAEAGERVDQAASLALNVYTQVRTSLAGTDVQDELAELTLVLEAGIPEAAGDPQATQRSDVTRILLVRVLAALLLCVRRFAEACVQVTTASSSSSVYITSPRQPTPTYVFGSPRASPPLSSAKTTHHPLVGVMTRLDSMSLVGAVDVSLRLEQPRRVLPPLRKTQRMFSSRAGSAQYSRGAIRTGVRLAGAVYEKRRADTAATTVQPRAELAAFIHTTRAKAFEILQRGAIQTRAPRAPAAIRMAMTLVAWIPERIYSDIEPQQDAIVWFAKFFNSTLKTMCITLTALDVGTWYMQHPSVIARSPGFRQVENRENVTASMSALVRLLTSLDGAALMASDGISEPVQSVIEWLRKSEETINKNSTGAHTMFRQLAELRVNEFQLFDQHKFNADTAVRDPCFRILLIGACKHISETDGHIGPGSQSMPDDLPALKLDGVTGAIVVSNATKKPSATTAPSDYFHALACLYHYLRAVDVLCALPSEPTQEVAPAETTTLTSRVTEEEKVMKDARFVNQVEGATQLSVLVVSAPLLARLYGPSVIRPLIQQLLDPAAPKPPTQTTGTPDTASILINNTMRAWRAKYEDIITGVAGSGAQYSSTQLVQTIQSVLPNIAPDTLLTFANKPVGSWPDTEERPANALWTYITRPTFIEDAAQSNRTAKSLQAFMRNCGVFTGFVADSINQYCNFGLAFVTVALAMDKGVIELETLPPPPLPSSQPGSPAAPQQQLPQQTYVQLDDWLSIGFGMFLNGKEMDVLLKPRPQAVAAASTLATMQRLTTGSMEVLDRVVRAAFQGPTPTTGVPDLDRIMQRSQVPIGAMQYLTRPTNLAVPHELAIRVVGVGMVIAYLQGICEQQGLSAAGNPLVVAGYGAVGPLLAGPLSAAIIDLMNIDSNSQQCVYKAHTPQGQQFSYNNATGNYSVVNAGPYNAFMDMATSTVGAFSTVEDGRTVVVPACAEGNIPFVAKLLNRSDYTRTSKNQTDSISKFYHENSAKKIPIATTTATEPRGFVVYVTDGQRGTVPICTPEQYAQYFSWRFPPAKHVHSAAYNEKIQGLVSDFKAAANQNASDTTSAGSALVTGGVEDLMQRSARFMLNAGVEARRRQAVVFTGQDEQNTALLYFFYFYTMVSGGSGESLQQCTYSSYASWLNTSNALVSDSLASSSRLVHPSALDFFGALHYGTRIRVQTEAISASIWTEVRLEAGTQTTSGALSVHGAPATNIVNTLGQFNQGKGKQSFFQQQTRQTQKITYDPPPAHFPSTILITTTLPINPGVGAVGVASKWLFRFFREKLRAFESRLSGLPGGDERTYDAQIQMMNTTDLDRDYMHTTPEYNDLHTQGAAKVTEEIQKNWDTLVFIAKKTRMSVLQVFDVLLWCIRQIEISAKLGLLDDTGIGTHSEEVWKATKDFWTERVEDQAKHRPNAATFRAYAAGRVAVVLEQIEGLGEAGGDLLKFITAAHLFEGEKGDIKDLRPVGMTAESSQILRIMAQTANTAGTTAMTVNVAVTADMFMDVQFAVSFIRDGSPGTHNMSQSSSNVSSPELNPFLFDITSEEILTIAGGSNEIPTPAAGSEGIPTPAAGSEETPAHVGGSEHARPNWPEADSEISNLKRHMEEILADKDWKEIGQGAAPPSPPLAPIPSLEILRDTGKRMYNLGVPLATIFEYVVSTLSGHDISGFAFIITLEIYVQTTQTPAAAVIRHAAATLFSILHNWRTTHGSRSVTMPAGLEVGQENMNMVLLAPLASLQFDPKQTAATQALSALLAPAVMGSRVSDLAVSAPLAFGADILTLLADPTLVAGSELGMVALVTVSPLLALLADTGLRGGRLGDRIVSLRRSAARYWSGDRLAMYSSWGLLGCGIVVGVTARVLGLDPDMQETPLRSSVGQFLDNAADIARSAALVTNFVAYFTYISRVIAGGDVGGGIRGVGRRIEWYGLLALGAGIGAAAHGNIPEWFADRGATILTQTLIEVGMTARRARINLNEVEWPARLGLLCIVVSVSMQGGLEIVGQNLASLARSVRELPAESVVSAVRAISAPSAWVARAVGGIAPWIRTTIAVQAATSTMGGAQIIPDAQAYPYLEFAMRGAGTLLLYGGLSLLYAQTPTIRSSGARSLSAPAATTAAESQSKAQRLLAFILHHSNPVIALGIWDLLSIYGYPIETIASFIMGSATAVLIPFLFLLYMAYGQIRPLNG